MKKPKIAILDYGMGNLFSIASACKISDMDPIITSNKTKIENAAALILPGVGAFNEAMSRLKKKNLIETIIDFLKSGKNIFGICLGMQLLFSRSFEYKKTKGLGIVNGEIKKFKTNTSKNLKIPNTGWSKIEKDKQNWDETFFKDIKNQSYMYFVHSFYAEPKEAKIILSKSFFGEKTFCSSINYENIFATQFHPEKSGSEGIQIYKNFMKGL
tara:strand:+ start:632 stop:1270 length:639 start_codon:yes stop_codon:yes gene_type:complete